MMPSVHPFFPGDVWINQSRRHQGQTVEIVKVTPLNVKFKMVGSSGKGNPDGRRHQLSHDAFRNCYTPKGVVLGLPDTQQAPADVAVEVTTTLGFDEAEPAIKAGDSWICVTATSRGLPVRIVEVSPTDVRFTVRRKLRGEETVSTLDIARFRERFVPTALAEIRQQELRGEARRGVAPAPVDGGPPPPVEVSEPSKQGRGGFRPKLAGTEKIDAAAAIEIVQLYRNGERWKELGDAFGTSQGVIRLILLGARFGDETAEARGLPADRRELPARHPKETPAVAVDAAVAEVGDAARRLFGENTMTEIENAAPVPTAPYFAEVTRRNHASAPAMLLQLNRDERETSGGVDPFIAPTQEPRVHIRQDAVHARRLEELTEALRLVLPYVGKPLPRFVSIDTAAIGALVEG